MYLILGGSGMLGSSLIEGLAKFGSPKILVPSHAECDITNLESIRAYCKDQPVGAVINCAAAANVDWCELNPQRAFEINANGAGNVAKFAKERGARMIHISTDFVFDGRKHAPYVETDAVNPVQVYGASKLFGEKRVLQQGGSVLRVQWLYGHTKKNFVEWVIAQTRREDDFKAKIVTQLGAPCSTLWLAQVILIALAKNKLKPKQVYHATHENSASRWAMVNLICRHFGVQSTDFFESADSIDVPALRPVDTRMSVDKLKGELGLSTLGTWEEDLQYYLSVHHPRRS